MATPSTPAGTLRQASSELNSILWQLGHWRDRHAAEFDRAGKTGQAIDSINELIHALARTGEGTGTLFGGDPPVQPNALIDQPHPPLPFEYSGALVAKDFAGIGRKPPEPLPRCGGLIDVHG